jgi:hypothetical protein
MRLLVLQFALAIVIGSTWLAFISPAQSMAFAIGAMAVTLGQYVQSVVAFTGGVRKAADWFGRFLLAVLLKWLTVFSLMLLGMRWLASAPLAGLAGIVFSLLRSKGETWQLKNQLVVRPNTFSTICIICNGMSVTASS